MSWARLDDRFWSNRKIRAAGDAVAAYVRCLSWCADELTDGFIPKDEVAYICAGLSDVDGHIGRLLEVGLLREVEGSLHIPDYTEINPKRADVEARREADRQRKAKGRKTQAGARNDSEPTPSRSDTESAQSPDGLQTDSSGPVPSRPVPQEKTSETADAATDPTTPDPVDVELCEHLAGQIEAVHGKRPKQPTRWFTDMRLLRERGPTDWETAESIDPPRIRRLIDWALNDDFWRDQIRSPAALRKHWERLRSAANEERDRRRNGADMVPNPDLEPRSTIADAEATRRMLDEANTGDHAAPTDAVRRARQSNGLAEPMEAAAP